ncbi:MAG: fold metallo-hydrolase [Thermomicrobiales bacterium]|nr:fold metallo-hydrolase [Thermomicrobiales bacterium]
MTRRLQSPTIDVDELRSMLAERQPVTVLDIRKAEDRAEWAIPGSLHIDAYEALKAGDPGALADAAISMDAPVVTICGLAWNSAELPVPGSAATVIQVRRTGKGCLSYLIGNDGQAVVIDAALPPEVYQELAAQHGWTITGVLDTHVHADHFSRSRLLAAATGATLHMPEQDRVTYPFTPIRDGDPLTIGSSRLTPMRTPGHTLESTSYLLDGQALFTGDTLFLAGVGRPDLEASPEQARDLRANRRPSIIARSPRPWRR